MTDFEDLNQAFLKMAEGVNLLQLEARNGLIPLLEGGRARINEILARLPSDYQQWRLTALQQQIEVILNDAYSKSADHSEDVHLKAWRAGSDSVVKPIQAAGLNLTFNALESETLLAMGAFQTQLLTNAGQDVVNRINATLAGVVAGIDTPFEAIKSINKTLDGGFGMVRAQRTVVTEVGRAFSTASFRRMQQAAEDGLKIRKKWLRSGKIYSRESHDSVHEQLQDINDPFIVDGERMMHPREAGASASNTINCGCSFRAVVSEFDDESNA